MNNDIQVRSAVTDDIQFLVESNLSMASETEHRVLDSATLSAGVRGVFERPQRGFYLIAERGAVRVGCMMVTSEWSDWRNGDWWWLQSVYVVPYARRSGVFNALYAAVEQRAAHAGDVVGLRLYVEKDNLRAKSTYESLGMQPAYYHLYECLASGVARNRTK